MRAIANRVARKERRTPAREAKQATLRPRMPAKLRRAFNRTLRAARIERTWYRKRPMMNSRQIKAAIRTGKLVAVKTTALLRVVKSEDPTSLGGVQYPYLTPASARLLDSIANEFHERQQPLPQKFFLSVTSMTRDLERQVALRRAGYPAAKESTHGLGEAFDINVKFFQGESPPHFELIKEILNGLARKGAINLIDETEINGALHVARNPTYRG